MDETTGEDRGRAVKPLRQGGVTSRLRFAPGSIDCPVTSPVKGIPLWFGIPSLRPEQQALAS